MTDMTRWPTERLRNHFDADEFPWCVTVKRVLTDEPACESKHPPTRPTTTAKTAMQSTLTNICRCPPAIGMHPKSQAIKNP
ncbi:hypothetical protein AB4059_02035 [Lysobacter sp. 2RAF19]